MKKMGKKLSKNEQNEQSVTSPPSFQTEWGVKIELAMGDITKMKVDCIVNAANNEMLGGGGVDGAIHRAAGPRLLSECRKVPMDKKTFERCPTGVAILTRGPFSEKLSAANVIHTVGPIMHSVDKIPEGRQLLSGCISNSLLIAQQESYKSIAFPAISCGIYNSIGDRWTDEAAECNVSTVLEFLRNCAERGELSTLSLKTVEFIFNDEKLFATWHEKLVQLVTNGGFQAKITASSVSDNASETASGGKVTAEENTELHNTTDEA